VPTKVFNDPQPYVNKLFRVLGNTNIKEDFEREETITNINTNSKTIQKSNNKYEDVSKYKKTTDRNEKSEFDQSNNNVSTGSYDEKLKKIKNVIIREHDIYPNDNKNKELLQSQEINSESEDDRLTPKLAG